MEVEGWWQRALAQGEEGGGGLAGGESRCQEEGRMKDPELDAQLLGIVKPWEVKAVKLDVGGKRVERLPVHDHVERSGRHLDTRQFETRIERSGAAREVS